MFKNKIHISLLFILILSIWGCGTMVKEDDTLSVPQKVSIDMPKALEIKSTKSEKALKQNKEDSKKSLAYLELKDDVEFLEGERVNLEINLLFINEVISTIDSQCKKFAIEEPCIIEDESLSFLFDENLSRNLKKITSEDLGYELGELLTFGEIEFIKHAVNNKYSFTLKMDTSFDDENSTSFQYISWSKDKKLILSEYIEESGREKNSIKINFVEEDNSKKMLVEDSLLNKEDGSSDTFHFDILKKLDKDETYELNSSSLAIDSDGEKNSFTSLGQLSNLGGYLNFIGEFDNEIFKENDSFDGEGNILISTYCYSGMDCELEDEDSWFVY